MKKHFLLIYGLLIIGSTKAQNNLKLWYTKPAQVWEEALPLGDGLWKSETRNLSIK